MSSTTKKICLVSLVFVGLGFWFYSQNVTAQMRGSGASIAVCNPNRVIQAYKKAITMRADLIDEKNRMQQKAQAAQKELQDKSEELTASGFTPESQEYMQMRKELLRKSIENETFMKVSENELRLMDSQIKDVCLRDMLEAVRKIAERKGLMMVFQQVLYADDSLDITSDVIEQLNTDYELGG